MKIGPRVARLTEARNNVALPALVWRPRQPVHARRALNTALARSADNCMVLHVWAMTDNEVVSEAQGLSRTRI